jgi:flagellar basal-body rod protein FlgF
MNYGLYISAAGMQAQMAKQDVITNNIANSQTAGFKRDLVMMQARRNAAYEDPKMFPYRLPVVKNQGGGVYALGDGIDLTQSTFEETSNATDVALNGKGFFTVAGDNGEKLLTRDGRFMIAQDGKLLTTSGNRAVLDMDGQPITLDPNLPVEIANDGLISQNGQGSSIKLGLTDVSDQRQLVKLGGNVMRVHGELVPAAAGTKILQYKLEHSGVEPMVEIVNMLEGQRAFEANARMLTYQDTTLSQLNTVGRVA